MASHGVDRVFDPGKWLEGKRGRQSAFIALRHDLHHGFHTNHVSQLLRGPNTKDSESKAVMTKSNG